jgi:hypothetical protein
VLIKLFHNSIRNPLRERTGAELDGDVTRAYERLELHSVVALDVLKRGARVAQNPKNPHTVPGITPAELESIVKEEELGFREQTKFLKVCSPVSPRKRFFLQVRSCIPNINRLRF